ncbi:transcriptional regulatory protein ZraR [Clostridium homopropionicum DSM 5847]|uniref:Stage 0 sporulation protein A homolog n=1 Tax=Clostridium homopropionicum DSM 5847 TaxID=1121318 RepID=A0A0L6ZCB0_9CLOT|nr:sigma-54 dependent transcriptional regulator [Clostridium homopropionicum]KOA20605.1 transcriptional regulatory protein ZraR [Clostridium homopropionicum DSM 5847]SFF93332.1 two component, sigma54 specific, transcriptional regulator, Fis family [Clostridium homopropionicum]
MGRILVIDDEEYIGWIIQKTFENTDNEVLTALDGKSGILEVHKKNFDLVFLDLRLPDMDGMKVLEELKKIQKDIIVIIITAHGSIDTAIESMKRGAFDYITKPFDVDELMIQAEKAMEIGRLKGEVKYLRDEEAKKISSEEFHSKNEKLNLIYKAMEQIGKAEAAVLITGENGTGKKVIARRLHQLSNRQNGPFITFNCGAISDEKAEEELFGYEKDSLRNYEEKRLGKFELANKGTIFLDDIEEMSLNMQLKLLRVLEEKEIQRVGEKENIKVDVRVIAASNKDLKEAVSNGTFREELYYKLNVIPIEIPPLRERKEDISDLVDLFIRKYDMHNKIKGISSEALKMIRNYHWPGNIRELENVIERIVILSNEPYIKSTELPIEILDQRKKAKEPIIYFPEEGISLEEVERELIIKALSMSKNNQSKAAQLLGITRSALIYRMQKYLIN